ncbi:MAG: hypothetical protein ACP5UV_00840 [Thermoplasmata archaeon]
MDNIEDILKTADKNFEKEKYVDALRDYLKVLDQIEDEERKAETAYKVSQIYHVLQSDSTENSLKFANISMEIHKKLGENDLVSIDLINIGYIYSDAGNHEEGLKNFDAAIEAAKLAGDKELEKMALLSKADAVSEKDKAESKKIYKEVLEESEKDKDWENYFESLHGLISLKRDEDENEAFQMSKDALLKIDQIIAGMKNKKDRKAFKDSVSYIYDEASDIAMSLENVDEAIKIAKSLSD